MGLPIDFTDMDTAVGELVRAAHRREFAQVATVNLDFMVHGWHDPEVRSILNQTAMNLPDGWPVAWAGRMLGHDGAARLAGADLVPKLVAAAAQEGLRVFLLGGEAGVAAEAATILADRHHGLEVDWLEPSRAPLEDMDDASILARVHSFEPHILLVAFGHPKQEKWISRNKFELPMVAVGVGCSLDLLAGRRSRAPEWVQRSGLEWGYRLIREPGRLARRYTLDGVWMTRTLVPWVISRRLGYRVN